MQQSPPTPTAPRDTTFDILKGIGILEVMLHHLLSHSVRKFAVAGSPEAWAMTIANRVFHFAVPAFLLVSALLLARSLASRPRPDWKRFYLRRAQRTLWPYLLWSVVYIFFRVLIVRIGDDVAPAPVTLPWGVVTLPFLLADAKGLAEDFFWGKAYYHLYFLVVLLQFSLAFPLFLYLLRRCFRLRFGGALLLSGALQLLIYIVQARYVRAPYPASLMLWYLPPIFAGVWLGLNWAAWPPVWRAWRGFIALATLIGFGIYMGLSVSSLRGESISSLWFNAAFNVYTTGISLLLLAGAGRLAAARRGGWVARVGDWSLPLFLLHPLVLFLLSGPTISRVWDALPLAPLWVGLAMFAVTWGLAALTHKLRVDVFLFGRSLSPGQSGG